MKNSFSQFLTILADNSYTPKYKDIPDYVDNRDEIIAEHQEILDDDGHLPDSMRYFSVNGKTSASELAAYIENSFQHFKIEFFSGNHSANKVFKTELKKQLLGIRSGIVQLISETKQIGDDRLNTMMDIKLQFCNEVINFIMNTQDDTNKPEKVAENKKVLSFKWLKGDECLQVFYHKMKTNGLIAENTSEPDFKAVFSNIDVTELKNPVQWEKGAKLFAYFFNLLMKNKHIPQRPSWILLQYCFTYYKGDSGSYVPIQERNKAHMKELKELGAPKEAELVDELFNECRDQDTMNSTDNQSI